MLIDFLEFWWLLIWMLFVLFVILMCVLNCLFKEFFCVIICCRVKGCKYFNVNINVILNKMVYINKVVVFMEY